MAKHLDAPILNAWADGVLAPDERQHAAAHLAECVECRARAAGQAQTAQWLRRLPPEAPPPLLVSNILAALARRRRSEAARARWAAVSAAAALLGLALVALAWPDVARLLPAVTAAGASGISLTALLELPAESLASLAGSTVDWAAALTGGAGVALLTGLVFLAGAAFGGLAQLLRPGALDTRP
jgi:predicted anti-sigma-YlaC factor YlaD